MPRRPDENAIRIGHILPTIGNLAEVISGGTVDEIRASVVRTLAFERCFEIITEASRSLSLEIKSTEPEIDLKAIAGLGNVLRHDYEGVDVEISYLAWQNRIPTLAAALGRMNKI